MQIVLKCFLFLQPRFRELYKLDPESLLLPCFRKAVRENTEESFRRIMFEPFPGVYVFKMFQPDFFQKLLVEVIVTNTSSCHLFSALLLPLCLINQVENMRKWLHEAKLMIRKPNNKSKYGVVLDDFGMDIMLKPLVEDFIFPICKGKAYILLKNALERLLKSNIKLHYVVLQYSSLKCVEQCLTLNMDSLLKIVKIGMLN